MSEAMPPRTPGEMLREARQARALSLEQVHERTKIPLRMLEALERDEYQKLSGPLYVKSFLRHYAASVGLDPEQVVDVYDQAAGPHVAPVAEMADVWTEESVEVRRVGVQYGPLLWRVGIVLAVVGVVVLGVWRLVTHKPAPPAEPALPMVETVTPAETTATVPDSVAAPPDSVRVLPHAMAGRAGMGLQDGKRWPLILRVTFPHTQNCAVRADGQESRPLIWADPPPPLPVTGPAAGRVYLTANGTVAYWGAADHLTITLDDLAGVEVTLNGQLIDTDGWRAGRPVSLDRDALGAGGP